MNACHVCKTQTDLCCSDCAISLSAKVHVCATPACRVAHDAVCPKRLEDRVTLATALLRRSMDAGAREYGEYDDTLHDDIRVFLPPVPPPSRPYRGICQLGACSLLEGHPGDCDDLPF